MEIRSETLDDHQVKLTVEVESDRFEQVKRRAARKLSRETKIPGFRPGKAPYQVIQRHVGAAALLEEALDTLIDEIYPEVLDQSEIEPYGPGSLDDVTGTDPPVLEFRVPLAPVVTLGDYRALQQPYEPQAVTEEDVQKVLEQVQADQAILEPVDRPAQISDVTYLTLQAHELLEDGQVNAEEPLVPSRKLNLRVRAADDEAEDEWPFPGFSYQLVGKEQGQSYTLEHEFPDEERFENFQGKAVRFEFQIDEVKSRDLPDIDDELAQSIGEYETLEDLRAFILESLETHRRTEYNQEYDDELLEKIVEGSTIRYPPQMLEREIDILRHELEDSLSTENLDLDIYLKTREMSVDDLDEELRPVAERRIKRGLVLMEVAEVEKIEVQPEDVQEDVTRTIDQFYQLMPEREAKQRLTPDAIQSLVSQMIGDRMTTLTVERLRDIARGTKEAVEESEAAEAETIPADPAAESEPADPPSAEILDPEDPPESGAEYEDLEGGADPEDSRTEPVKTTSETE